MSHKITISFLSNFQNLPFVLQQLSTQNNIQVSFEQIPPIPTRFRAFRTFLKALKNNILILNIEETLLLKLCFLKFLFPWKQCLLFSVDILLKPSMTFRDRILCRIRRCLLKKVDCFILYFKDISGYKKYYNLLPEKFVYVPFKVNQLDEIQTHLSHISNSQEPSDGDCIMAIGRSLRDTKTFIQAMANTKLPGVILRQSDSIMAQHGTIIRNEHLPPNLKEVVHDGEQHSFIQHIANAKIIVIPRFHWDIKSTGISTYLMAMALKKCVIISHGPGTTELLCNNEAILVPPEDVNSLTKAILKAWNQTRLRRKIASNGQKYAFSLKDNNRLLWDIVNVSYNQYIQKR